MVPRKSLNPPSIGRSSRDVSSGSGDLSVRRTLTPGTVRRIPASELAFFPPPAPPSRASERDDVTTSDSSPSMTSTSSPRLSPRALNSRYLPGSHHHHSSTLPNLPLLTSNVISSSLRGIPSLFGALPIIPTSRMSISSEDTSERSRSFEELDVELDNATEWKSRHTHHPNGGALRKKASRGVGKAKLADIDWGGGSATTLRPGRLNPDPSSYASSPIGDLRARTIKTQQPSPSPVMELPGKRPP